MHQQLCQAALRCVFFCSNHLSIHPSVSVIPSHSLSVFHHSISKPDPRVNPGTPPSWTEPITTCPMASQICNFLTCRLQSCAQCTMRVGLTRHRNKHGGIPFTPSDPFLRSFFRPQALRHATFCPHGRCGPLVSPCCCPTHDERRQTKK